MYDVHCSVKNTFATKKPPFDLKECILKGKFSLKSNFCILKSLFQIKKFPWFAYCKTPITLFSCQKMVDICPFLTSCKPFNLFVTSKIEYSNSPNLKCSIKAKEPFKPPF